MFVACLLYEVTADGQESILCKDSHYCSAELAHACQMSDKSGKPAPVLSCGSEVISITKSKMHLDKMIHGFIMLESIIEMCTGTVLLRFPTIFIPWSYDA